MRAKPRPAHALSQHLLHRPAALTWSLDVAAAPTTLPTTTGVGVCIPHLGRCRRTCHGLCLHPGTHGLESFDAHNLQVVLLLTFSLNYHDVASLTSMFRNVEIGSFWKLLRCGQVKIADTWRRERGGDVTSVFPSDRALDNSTRR